MLACSRLILAHAAPADRTTLVQGGLFLFILVVLITLLLLGVALAIFAAARRQRRRGESMAAPTAEVDAWAIAGRRAQPFEPGRADRIDEEIDDDDDDDDQEPPSQRHDAGDLR